jgi:nicotinate-nucleotide--dimethylbenzimidazole phosphoribosyltransferase
MISALEEFRPVIMALPTGPVMAGPVTHPRLSVYAASATGEDVAMVQAQVAAIASGVWERAVAAVDADLRLYELAVETPSTALGDVEAANLIGYGMTTVEPGVDLLALAGLNKLFCHPREGGDPGRAQSALYGPGSSAFAEDDTYYINSIDVLAQGASRDIAALLGAMIAARMANVPVLAAGGAARAAVALLRALNPQAVGHITEIEAGEFDSVFGLTAAIAARR